MGRLEDGVAGIVVDVCSRRDADAAHLRGQRVGQIIAVQVHRGDYVVILRPDEDELQGHVGDGIFEQQFRFPLAVAVSRPQLQRLFHFLLDIVLLVGRHHVEARVDHLGVICHAQVRVLLFVAQDPRLTLADDVIAKLTFGQRVAPLHEGTFRVLHNVSLVHEVHVLALVRQRPFDSGADEPFRALHGNRLERDTGCLGKTNLRILLGEVFFEQ